MKKLLLPFPETAKSLHYLHTKHHQTQLNNFLYIITTTTKNVITFSGYYNHWGYYYVPRTHKEVLTQQNPRLIQNK